MSIGGDMIASLYHLPHCEPEPGIHIKRAFVSDKPAIEAFIREHFSEGWVYEMERALLQDAGKCFIATVDRKVLGFACFDGTARGFFGPIGVHPDAQGRKIGTALLLRTLEAMREYGYAYAIIGWVNDAAPFYRKVVNATYIPGGTPDNSVYSNLIMME